MSSQWNTDRGRISETEKIRRALKKREIFCRCVYTGEPLPPLKVKMVRRIKGPRKPVRKTIHI